jgi:hypothetical protein
MTPDSPKIKYNFFNQILTLYSPILQIATAG